MSTVLKRAKIDEQWHAHQGLGHAGLVDAFVYYSPWVMPGVRSDEEPYLNPYQSSLPTVSNSTDNDSMEWYSSFCWTFVLLALPSLASRVCIPLGCVGADYAFRNSSTAWQLGSLCSILIAAIAFAWFANRIMYHSHLRCLGVLIATTCLASCPIVIYQGKLPNENSFLMITVFTVLSQSAIYASLARMGASRMIRVVFLTLIVYSLGCAIGVIDVIVVALADP